MSAQGGASTSETPRLSAALWYASLGWSVVPVHKVIVSAGGVTACSCPAGAACTSKGKHPAVAWTQYQRKAATVEQIRAWFTGHFASYGVGIITGAVSGFVVVDVDEGPGKAGGDTLNDLQFLNGDLPHTVIARTGGGGKHIFLLHPRDVWIQTGRNVLGPGVDVRGDGGFIVAAPSLHESGRYYLWDDAAHPNNTPIVAAPAWVIEMAEAPPPDLTGQRAPQGGQSTGTGEIVRDSWGKVIDGRERFMVGIICGCIATLARETGALPTAEAVVAEAWPTYERGVRARGVSLDADNRGIALMRQRVPHFLRRAETGKWKLKPQVAQTGALPFDPETGEILPPPPRQKATVKEPAAILTMRELDALPSPQWLIEGLIPEKSLIVPFGAPKSGKTFLVLSFCLHVAGDKEWFGHAVRAGGVVYIAGEGTGGLSLRLRAMRQSYGIDVGAPLWIIPKAVNFRLDGEVDGLISLVRKTVGDTPLRVVVIDTLARAMPGADENSAQEVGLVIAGCDKVRDELGCAVIPIHHSGKDVARGARGTSALRGAWDTALEITSAASGKRVTMTVVDQKEAEAGQRLVFRMDTIAVGIGRTSLVPVLDDNPDPDMAGQKPDREITGHAGLVLRALQDVMAGPESAVLPPFDGLPQGDVRGVPVEVLRRKVYERMPTVSQEARQKAFVRSIQNLMRMRAIGVRDPWAWLV
jgi:hypothetical protein